MKLKVATYNILHGTYSDLVIKNILFLIDQGVDIVCLQEAEVEFESVLNNLSKNKGFEVVYFHHGVACNIAILWNPIKLTYKNSNNFLLPKLSKPGLMQKITNYPNSIFERGGMSAYFFINYRVIRITNVHLACEGSIKHRMDQLECVQRELVKDVLDADVLLGDFNTFAPAMFREIQKKKVEAILPGWSNVFKTLEWSCDGSYTSPRDGLTKYVNFGKLFGIQFRCLLDYIFVKDLEIISSQMFDLPGSDHRPLFVEFKIR